MNDKSDSRVAELPGTSGCATIVVAPLAALLPYPHATWLFAFVIVGIALLAIAIRLRRDPSPMQIADDAERILNGLSQGWDVDDYEHLNPRDPRVRELWSQTMAVYGLPEEWGRLNEKEKDELRNIILTIRELGDYSL